MNPRRIPEGIRGRHPADQGAEIGGDGRPTRTAPALPSPEQAKALTVPRDHGLWLDQDEGGSPAGPRL